MKKKKIKGHKRDTWNFNREDPSPPPAPPPLNTPLIIVNRRLSVLFLYTLITYFLTYQRKQNTPLFPLPYTRKKYPK